MKKLKRLIANFDPYFELLKPVFYLGLILLLINSLGIKINNNRTLSPSPNIIAVSQAMSKARVNDLIIPALDINVPVIWDVNGFDKNDYLPALQNGVAKFLGSANPGEGGNVFIFGHSSYYPDDPGKYKQVFTHLDQLKNSDVIYLWWQEKEYKYQVIDIALVSSNNLAILQPTKEEQLTLMTCWPPGTTLRRLIVIAKPI